MYLTYYGLTEKPFNLTPDPKYFFASGGHAEARDLLRYGIREREGFMSFVGATGTGKTTLLRTVLEEFGDEVVTALVLNPFLSEEDLLRIILVDFGICTREELASESGRRYTKQDLIDRLNDHLMTLSMTGRTAVLVIDEAQNLPLPVLEQIRLLSNLETSKTKLLQIVLAGQLGLRELLASPHLSQLAQRVSVRYTLQPLNVKEVGRYLDHRLRIAGSAGDIVVSDAAVQRIYRYSQGVPRLVNLVCDRALLAGYTQRTSNIGPELIERAADTLDLARRGASPPVESVIGKGFAPVVGRKLWKPLTAAVAAATILVGGYALLSDDTSGELQAKDLRAGSYQGTTPTAETSSVASPRPAPVEIVPTPSPGTTVSGDPLVTAVSPEQLAMPSGAYTVYLSSFRSPRDPYLMGLRSKIADAGYESFIVGATVAGQGTLHRLVVGDFTDEESATTMAGQLRRDLEISHSEVVAVAEILGG